MALKQCSHSDFKKSDVEREFFIVEGPKSQSISLEKISKKKKSKKEIRNARQQNGGTLIKDLMNGMGLIMIGKELRELKRE